MYVSSAKTVADTNVVLPTPSVRKRAGKRAAPDTTDKTAVSAHASVSHGISPGSHGQNDSASANTAGLTFESGTCVDATAFASAAAATMADPVMESAHAS